jgi:hypothetical protein
MAMKENAKTERMSIVLSQNERAMLEKLSKLESRSYCGVITFLIKEKAKEYGLIESRV